MGRRGLPEEVGRLLRTTRERRGLSQARLAERVGASQQWLSKVERGVANATLADLERFFAGLQLRVRLEVAPVEQDAATDPDLALDLSDEDLDVLVGGYGFILRKLHDVPYLVGGRLAALAHGLPVRVHRLDLIVTHGDRGLLAGGLQRFNAVRWSERWQEYRDRVPADRPGPMRWRIGDMWELRVALVDELPPPVAVRLGDLDLEVPPLPWLTDHDLDFSDLAARLRAVGWSNGRA